ncbi:hypothetical protein B6S44_27285, partial [Bosea sp. Tri-44]
MNRLTFNPRRWPLAIKVPAVVALLLIIISAVLTNAVLSRLQQTQERHLRTVSTTHLNGLASVVVPYVMREDIWEIFDVIERAAPLAGGFGQALVIVTNGRRETLASSLPRIAPVASLQDERAAGFAPGEDLRIDMALERAYSRRDLSHQGRTIGTVHVDFSIAHLLAERNEVLRAFIATNAVIALILALLGYWVVRRMLRPLSLLSQHLEAGASRAVQPISSTELQF